MALFKMRDSWNVWRRKVDAALGGSVEPVKSEDVTYDNTDSGLTATNVQSAIDEVAGAVSGLTGENVGYDNTDSGLTATNVQSAIDEVASDISTLSNSLTAENIEFTAGATISNYGRTRITKIGHVVVCNIACLLTTATANHTEVLTISDTSILPEYDVFCPGISSGMAYGFKLSPSTGKITVEQLTNDTATIPANSGSFGNLVWTI